MMSERFDVKQKFKNKPYRVVDKITNVEYAVANQNDAFKLCALLNEMHTDVLNVLDAYVEMELLVVQVQNDIRNKRQSLNFKLFDEYCNHKL